MILTIMLWLGMWGQAQVELVEGAVTQSQMAHCEPHDDTLYCYGLVSGVPDTPMTIGRPKEWQCKAVPTEHVFEIRTKREEHGTAKDERSHGLGGTPHCDDPNDVLESPNQCDGNTCTSMYIAPHCVRLTRELWIDGKRLGTIKGLD